MLIIITGGADGLGKSIALKLISKGHELILIDKNVEKLESIKREFPTVEIYDCDITITQRVMEATKEILKKHKTIDVLINCAGVWLNEQSEKDLDKYKNMILVNLYGTIAMTKCLLPRFEKQNKGLIIGINSKAGVEPETNSPVYSATKYGLTGYRKSVRQEFGKNGIKITDICPGMIETGLFVKAGVKISKESFNNFALTSEQVAESVVWVIEQPQDVSIPSLEIKNTGENF